VQVRSHLVGLIGAGIGPSLSPALHEAEAAALGIPYVYRVIELDRPERAGELVRAACDLGFDGLNITHPAKQAVVPVLDELSPEAVAIGAVNTVVMRGGRLIGHNTDWSGFARSFTLGLPSASLDSVVILGAGGAGSAAAYAVARLGAEQITVVDAQRGRAEQLAASLHEQFGAHRIGSADLAKLPTLLDEADGVVHATPTGMRAHPGSAIAAELLAPPLWVADVVYRPLATELLCAARTAGCPTLDGGAMAVFQAADAFALFTGVEPDADRMLTHFAALIDKEGDG
jgi:shikimate dehydrogenase